MNGQNATILVLDFPPQSKSGLHWAPTRAASRFASRATSVFSVLSLAKPPYGASTARVVAQTAVPPQAQRRLAASDALFLLLVIVNVIRTLRHAMWRDELQIFLLALYSPSPWSLLGKLKYEAHPALWHMLVWVITRFTSDPMWMQVLHIGLAIGAWTIIYLWSPFNTLEKLLLLLSYFLFWEYFIISRSYVLIAFIAFAFISFREWRPRPDFALWLLLGLLANVQTFGTIWSMVWAAMLSIEGVRRRSIHVAGATVYLILLVFAIATMVPAPDYGPWGRDTLGVHRLIYGLKIPFGAFVPLSPGSIWDAIVFLAHPQTASIPHFWNVSPATELIALTHDTNRALRLALMILVLPAPIAACWVIARDPLLVLEFALVYLGILLFAYIWNFPGVARHHGIVFLALIASAWSARLRHPPAVCSSRVCWAFLIINACGGMLTLASELRPFSEGYNAAAWIKQSHLADSFLIGSSDAQTSTVAAYLGRPIYYLECECLGSFVVWNNKRIFRVSPEEFGRRLTKAVAMAKQRDTIFIRSTDIAEDLMLGSAGVSIAPLTSFTDALTDEKFWIYRVRLK